MEIRKLTTEENLAADRLESLSFVFPLPDDSEQKKEKPYLADRWGSFEEDGQLSATFTNHDLPIFFDGSAVTARGVGGVASDPISRGKGNIRALIHHVLTLDREQGALFSALYPFSHAFYRKFGYELCHELIRATFPTESLRVFRTDDPPQARMLDPKENLDVLYPLYTAFAKQYNLAIARDARTWKRIAIGDPYKVKDYGYVLSRGGQDVGYVIFRYRPQDQPLVRTLCVWDYAFVDQQAFFDLMSFLYRFAAQAKDVEMYVPGNLPLSSLFVNPYMIKIDVFARQMARVLNVEKVLLAMRHPQGEGTYSIYVEDPFLPDNEGGYRVTYADRRAVSVTRCDGDTDLRLSVQTLAQLTLGYLGLGQATFKPDVRISGNEAVLRQVFIEKPVFLWDFY